MTLRRMVGPPGLHHYNRHAREHYEFDSCTSEPPHCTPVNPDYVSEPVKPNQDHNHPPRFIPQAGADAPPRASVLNEARDLITGDRNNQYGPPTQDFTRTADLLNALGYRRTDAEGEDFPILASDVALIIAQVKVSRIIHSRGKRDSWVDLAGYAACGYECAEEEAKS